MNTEMNIKEIIAEVDALLSAGKDAKAEERLVDAIAKYTEAKPNDIVGQSVLLNELGGFYRSRGVFDKGEEAYLKAKSLLEEIRAFAFVLDRPAPSGCCICDTLNGSNTCCADGGEEPQSHVEIIYGNESETANYATTLNNLAGLYRLDKQLQKAADMFDEAIKVYENCMGNVPPDHIASCYNNKGLVYLDMRDADGARAMFLKAKEILEKGGEYKFALGTTISNLGFVSVIEKKFSDAIELFKAAKGLFVEAENYEMAHNCEEFLNKLDVRQ